MKRIPIICAGGIGDTLLTLAEFPIAALGRIGARFNIFYESTDHPAWKILRNFLESIEYCQLVHRPPSINEYRVRNGWKKIIRYSQFLFAPPIKKFGPSKKVHCTRRILVQTHMDGHHGHKHINAKIWPVDRWCELFLSLQGFGWDIWLLEWDESSREKIQHKCPFVVDARKLSFLETVLSIQDFDFVVSVDSWAKYVAGWWKIPQVVIVPDLRQGYTPHFENISADVLVEKWFRGLTKTDEIKLIGLEKSSTGYSFTLPSILDLKSNDILLSLESMLTTKK